MSKLLKLTEQFKIQKKLTSQEQSMVSMKYKDS